MANRIFFEIIGYSTVVICLVIWASYTAPNQISLEILKFLKDTPKSFQEIMKQFSFSERDLRIILALIEDNKEIESKTRSPWTSEWELQSPVVYVITHKGKETLYKRKGDLQ